MTERELAVRRRIMESFAETGAPPREIADTATLRALASRHILVLDEDDRILMAHPFAAHRNGTRGPHARRDARHAHVAGPRRALVRRPAGPGLAAAHHRRSRSGSSAT